ncbi:hypothetical protein ACTU3I_03315 [Microbacterium sp. RD1]|uniref:hypothetical protein n=1 Tax=Microbacterium sp. RD1 TaxID=3457313 RepID=UPI003FA56002
MPRSSIALTPSPLDADAISRGASSVHAQAGEDAAEFELRVLDGGAVLQVLFDDTVVLSVLRPRLLPTPAEFARVLPGITAPPDAQWWAEAYTPWHQGGLVGTAILDAAASGGLVVHQNPPPAVSPPSA